MDLEASSPCVQNPTIGPSSESFQFIPQIHTYLNKIHFNITLCTPRSHEVFYAGDYV
jgi:hypothetical protein